MSNTSKNLLILSILFGVLMSIPFIVPSCGWVALFAFIPLLSMDIVADNHKVKRLFPWYFLGFTIWNAISTLWVCKATVGGGIFAVLYNAASMSLVFALYRLGKKRFGTGLSYIFLVVIWLAWERFYFGAQFSWPWLTLGNAFARNIELVQWYEYTGTLGGSLWILASNIALFCLVVRFLGGGWDYTKAIGKILSPLLYLVLVGGPILLSLSMFRNYKESEEEGMDVYICQPNFDPYEKKIGIDKPTQASIFLEVARKSLESYTPKEDEAALLIGPETLTNDVVIGGFNESTTLNRFRSMLKEYPNLNFLFGAATREYFISKEAPSLTVRNIRDNLWVQGRNSAMMMDSSGVSGFFHKSKLVIGTEFTPFPRFFNKIDDMLGGVMGRCAGQDKITLLETHCSDSLGNQVKRVLWGSAICYESIYGEYCTGYVRAGAKALAVITNDAWWGNTPGYHQHLSYASLRAIELRRDIARCANTGISAIINQRGEIVKQSKWWEREALVGRVNLNGKLTFFARNGDIIGRVATLVFLLLFAALWVKIILRK